MDSASTTQSVSRSSPPCLPLSNPLFTLLGIGDVPWSGLVSVSVSVSVPVLVPVPVPIPVLLVPLSSILRSISSILLLRCFLPSSLS